MSSSPTIHKQAADTPADATSTPAPPAIRTTSVAENNGISSSNGKGSSLSNNNVADSSGVSSSTNNTTGATISSNPFSTSAVPQSQLWNTSSSTSSALSSDSLEHHRPVLAPSKFGGFGGGGGGSMAAGPSSKSGSSSILAPSKLFGGSGSVSFGISRAADSAAPGTASHQQASVKFKLKPSRLGSSVNPFAKTPALDTLDSEAMSKDKSDSDVSTSGSNTAASDGVASSSEVKTASDKPLNTSCTATPPPSPPHSSTSGGKEASSSSSTKGNISSSSSSGEASASRSVFGLFSARIAEEKTPAACSSPKPPTTLSTNGVKASQVTGSSFAASSSSFVFGQNLHSRISGTSDGGATASSSSSKNGEATSSTPDNLFSAAATEFAAKPGSGSDSSSQAMNGGTAKSLETSSRELEEKESREKRKFDEVEVITGEETESNVLQMNCKVYNWLKGSWVERGRGILRLNDWGSGGVEMHSRLVVRRQGTLTIMLNTNIWSEMAVERASNKSVRFTASDPDGSPKVYLVMGLPKEVDLLYTSLEWRVANSRRREQGQGGTKKARTEEPSSSTAS